MQKGKLILGELEEYWNSREDLFFRKKVDDKFNGNRLTHPMLAYLVSFHMAPVDPINDPARLSKFMEGLIPEGIEPREVQKPDYRDFKGEDGAFLARHFQFGRIMLEDVPAIQTVNYSDVLRILDSSLAGAYGHLPRKIEVGESLEIVLGSRNAEIPLIRRIDCVVYPNAKLADDAFEGRLDVQSFVNVKKLNHL